jgi:cobalamin biosynthesis protein CbiG
MKFISKETKTYKLFTALQAGDKLTQSDVAKRFGIKNIAAEASRIRQHGYAVYANSRKAGNGVTVTEYELGRPSREIVALGYKAKAMGIAL